jgi:hypothetical protein
MALDKQLMDLERKLWSNNALFYKDHLISASSRETSPLMRYWQKMQRVEDGLMFSSTKFAACS